MQLLEIRNKQWAIAPNKKKLFPLSYDADDADDDADDDDYYNINFHSNQFNSIHFIFPYI